MAQKLSLSDLKRMIKRTINESKLQNEFFEFNFDGDSDSEEKFNKSEDLGFKEEFSCKNGMVWGTVRNLKALSSQAKVAIPMTGSNDLAVLMDGEKIKAVVRFDPQNYALLLVRGPHNSTIKDSDIIECVVELGQRFGKMQAMNILRGAANFWRT